MTARRVVVVGGGISGLAAAFQIRERARERGVEVDVRVLESDATPGGKVRSESAGGFLAEAGPSGFLDNEPATLRLVDQLGLRDRLLRSSDAARVRYIVKRDGFHQLQMNPVLFMKSNLLSRRGRLRVVGEMFVSARKGGGEETVGSFGRRRLGKEFTETMLDSMVSGIFAGDVDKLCIQAAFPKVPAMEDQYGGLIKAMRAKRAEVRQRKKVLGPGAEVKKVEAGPGGVLHSFRGGMGDVIQSLAEHLGPHAVHTGVSARGLTTEADGYRIRLDADTVDADAVVLTTPAPVTADLLRDLAPAAAKELAGIPFAGVHVVVTGYAADQLDHDLHGFGALIPRKEGFRILGTLWNSSTFAHRAPDGSVLMTTMVGGAHDPAASQLSEEQLLDLVHEEIVPMYGIRGEPAFRRVIRWPAGIPQYELGHLDRVARAKAALTDLPGIFLGGNSVAGVSFNHCVKGGEDLADAVLDHFGVAAEAHA